MMLLRHTRDIHGSSINAAMMMLCPQHHGGSGERESSRCNKSQQLGARFVSNVGKVLTRGREPCTSKNCVSRLSSDSGRCQVDLHRHLTGCLTFRNSPFSERLRKGVRRASSKCGEPASLPLPRVVRSLTSLQPCATIRKYRSFQPHVKSVPRVCCSRCFWRLLV